MYLVNCHRITILFCTIALLANCSSQFSMDKSVKLAANIDIDLDEDELNSFNKACSGFLRIKKNESFSKIKSYFGDYEFPNSFSTNGQKYILVNKSNKKIPIGIATIESVNGVLYSGKLDCSSGYYDGIFLTYSFNLEESAYVQ